MAPKGSVNNVIRIPTSLKTSFFRLWIEFLTPLHGLTNREKDVVASFLKARFELSYSISDEALLDKFMLSDDIKTRVKEECGISESFFNVLISKLKQAKVIVSGKLNPKFIPKNLDKEDSAFKLMFYFDLNGSDN